MSFYNLWGGHLKRDSRGEIYGAPRKKYTRNYSYPEHVIRFSALPREKSAIRKLRNFGYSINHIAQGLGRSTSFIHKAISGNAKLLGLVRVFDNREINRNAKLLNARRKLNSCLFHIQQWTAFICGEDSDPP